ncbi:hypothetical protein D1007_26163 [Hordeum vulgare]|nr:hypothetical protein D1007_26163 [Hordeum vulgare]
MEKGMDDSYNKAGGAGEVRRINVVYFLSRGGRTDHPHLFRVNHLHRSGVRLRDVKRLALGGPRQGHAGQLLLGLQRKYKAGYVWQDLMDDDLITPIADNEYVLKGCDVRGTPPPCADEKKLDGREEKGRKVLPCDQKQVEEDLQERKRRQQEATRSAAIDQQALVVRAAAPGGKKQQPAAGRAPRMCVARVLHSILTCGAADSVDAAALQPVALPRRSGAGRDDDDDDGWRDATPVCPGMDGCGIHMNRKARLRRAGGKDKAKREGRKRDGAVAAAHKPASLPLCS